MTFQAWLYDRSPLTRRIAPALTIMVLVAVIALGFANGLQKVTPPSDPSKDDLSFYARVIDRVKHGQPYYSAAAAETRALHGALKPFLTVRPPLLARSLAALPNPAMGMWVVRALTVVSMTAWLARLRLTRLPPLQAAFTFVVVFSGFACAVADRAYLLHEVWAGLLIALALALYQPNRWGLSVAIALLAAIARELAAPFLLVMAGFALAERRPKEAMGWIAAFAAFAVALAAHALRVHAVLVPSDSYSPGWVGANSWAFVLHTATWNLLAVSWPSVVIVLLPLGLFGLLGAEDPAVKRAAVTVFGFTAGLLMFGRPENYYWGVVIAPLWPLGLLTAPRMLVGLARDTRALLPHGALSHDAGVAPGPSSE